MHRHVCSAKAYVHMKKQFCAHFCGAPFTGSICSARIRAPMKRTASMGAKNMEFVAPSKAFSSFGRGNLSHSPTALQTWMPPYTRKNWAARIIVHCTAGDTGGTLSPGHVPLGGSKVMMP